MEQKKTVGRASRELLEKQSDNTHTIEEQGKAQLDDYLDNLHTAVENEIARNPNADFFVVVITKKEPLFPNVFRNYFFARASCPTPDYDQAVYHYHHDTQQLEYLWVVPARDVCRHFLKNPLDASTDDEKALVGFIHDFTDKTLAKLQKKLNTKENRVAVTQH